MLMLITQIALNLAFAGSQIIETDKYSDIVESVADYSANDTLIVFDVDHTLLVVEECRNDDPDTPSFIRFMQNVRPCPAHLTERHVARDIKKFQDSGFNVLVLTARKFDIVEPTERELYRNDISPNKELIDDFEFEWREGRSWFFQNGAAYAGGKAKGKVMSELINRAGTSFKNIIFVDDKEKNIRSVNHTFKNRDDVDVLNIHYTRYQ